MWTLISGLIISNLFEYLIVTLYKNNFSNKSMTIVEIILGWLFQEHVREDFNMTGGKRFMLKKDFRKRFIINTVKITRNIVFWSHAVTTFELGSFLILLFLLFYLFWSQINHIHEQKAKYLIAELFLLFLLLNIINIKIYITVFFLLCILTCAIRARTKNKINYVSKELFIILTITTIINEGLKIYRIFDVFFITRPFVLFSIGIFIWFSIIWLMYLFYFILNKYSKTISLVIKLCYIKTILSFSCLFSTFNIILTIIEFENLNNENFFQELVLKQFFFFIFR